MFHTRCLGVLRGGFYFSQVPGWDLSGISQGSMCHQAAILGGCICMPELITSSVHPACLWGLTSSGLTDQNGMKNSTG